jgi:orotidine-5'-phosphate decarboxylase
LLNQNSTQRAANLEELLQPEYDGARERCYLALDVPSLDEAERLIDELADAVDGYKVGLELFYAAGSAIIEVLAKQQKRVFLDIKLHDIPTTVAHALRVVCNWPIEMVNVHSAGGIGMLEAARQAVDDSSHRPLLIGVTVLTSLSNQDLVQLGLNNDHNFAVAWSQLCQQAGLDGVVTSAPDVDLVAKACGPQFVTVVPGTRPVFASRDDQNRVLTPAEALARGAHRLVLGRAVTKAADKLTALKMIYDEMTSQLRSTASHVDEPMN